jgi:hypothetical protein
MPNYKFNDLTNRRFERLTAIEICGRDSHGRMKWLCACSCGKSIEVSSLNLITGNTRSCGCLYADIFREISTTHGLEKHPLYGVWSTMKSRCYNPNCAEYPNYGGRGIRVCERWKSSFVNFLADMGERPSKKYSIDRKNNDGNYDPNNCKWATRKEQGRNQRSNRYLEIHGRRMILSDWAREFGTNAGSLTAMLKRRPFEECYNYYKQEIRY